MTPKHLILMAIACLLPIAGLVAIFLFQIQISIVFLVALFLICPAMHLFMMRDHKGHTSPDHKAEREL